MTAVPNDFLRWLRGGALIWSAYFVLLMIADSLLVGPQNLPLVYWLYFGGSIVLLSVALFMAWQTFFRSREPLRIGYIGSLSGKYAAMGTSARNGALLAVEEINGAGGIDGRPLSLEIKDDAGNPDASLKAAQDLALEGIDLSAVAERGEDESRSLDSLAGGVFVIFLK